MLSSSIFGKSAVRFDDNDISGKRKQFYPVFSCDYMLPKPETVGGGILANERLPATNEAKTTNYLPVPEVLGLGSTSI